MDVDAPKNDESATQGDDEVNRFAEDTSISQLCLLLYEICCELVIMSFYLLFLS